MYAILSYRGNRPRNTQTHKQTNRQGRLQYTMPLSLACSVITITAYAITSVIQLVHVAVESLIQILINILQTVHVRTVIVIFSFLFTIMCDFMPISSNNLVSSYWLSCAESEELFRTLFLKPNSKPFTHQINFQALS